MPGITASNPLDLYYYPFTHSLAASFVWFGIAVVGYKLLRPGDGAWRMGLVVGGAVFSHWVLDLLVHRPDLPLHDDALKVGLGLWNYPALAFLFEAGLIFSGMWLYFRATSPVTAVGKYGLPVFGALLLATQAAFFFGSPPPSPSVVATSLLITNFVGAGVVYWLEKKQQ